jgi:bifunctional N-acetylglucosamine-1-phosphate-uridyltransferase/glucosamine-1-phosphate-acetyltransferase GlmU-like protein
VKKADIKDGAKVSHIRMNCAIINFRVLAYPHIFFNRCMTSDAHARFNSVRIGGHTTIEEDVWIGQYSEINNSTIHSNANIKQFSHLFQ